MALADTIPSRRRIMRRYGFRFETDGRPRVKLPRKLKKVKVKSKKKSAAVRLPVNETRRRAMLQKALADWAKG